jgi:hypothetical protein
MIYLAQMSTAVSFAYPSLMPPRPPFHFGQFAGAAGGMHPPLAPAAAAAAAAVAGGGQAAGARPGLAVVINLDELLRTFVPLVFLSIKLSFLLYIFGRHASPGKRLILALMAFGWVVWEGWSMRRRRPPVEAHAQFRAQAAQAAQPQPPRAPAHAPAVPVPPPANGAQQRQQQPRPQPQPQPQAPGAVTPAALEAERARRTLASGRRHRTSRWTFKYWLNAVAGIGLMAEAREMGLTTRRTATSPPWTPAERAGSPWRRRGRALLTGVVLFVATLVPEVEKRRRRALEKRERIRLMFEQARANNAANAAAATTTTTTGVPAAPPTTASSTPEPVPDAADEHDGGDAVREDEVSDAMAAAVPSPANVSEEEPEDNRLQDPAVADEAGPADNLERPEAVDAMGMYATF